MKKLYFYINTSISTYHGMLYNIPTAIRGPSIAQPGIGIYNIHQQPTIGIYFNKIEVDEFITASLVSTDGWSKEDLDKLFHFKSAVKRNIIVDDFR